MTPLEWLGVLFILEIAAAGAGAALLRWHARRQGRLLRSADADDQPIFDGGQP